ncbi:MAG: pantoate--beta-alanine ligase [Gemmatimonadaceae bacterium]|nr:pantoate--beta-alanine ligase [Gemmatimonadaceae bacterium]
MVVVTAIADVRNAVAKARESGARVGFVPTMGALHDGHVSLVERAKREADLTVMSIFVNPLQFAPTEDLSRYPRPVQEDERLAADAGVDILFRPDVADMYPPGRVILVTAGDLGSDWEGKSRPGHFDGVLTVVTKLFNIVQPDFAVFGRKDLQQAALVQALVRDLDMPISIVVSPIVRESDGLAMSSRNRYLSVAERNQATILSTALHSVKQAFADGERDTPTLEAICRRVLASASEVRPDYVAVVDPATFRRSPRAEPGFGAILAARVGGTRLIDNVTLGSNDQD